MLGRLEVAVGLADGVGSVAAQGRTDSTGRRES